MFLIQFFALISNLKSELENFERVFFKWPLKFLMSNCHLIIKKYNNFFSFFYLKIDFKQKSIPVNFHEKL